MGNDQTNHDHDSMDHDEMKAPSVAGRSMSASSVSNRSTNPSVAGSAFASTEATLPHSLMDADEIAEEEHEDELDKRSGYISYRLISLNRTRVDTLSAGRWRPFVWHSRSPTISRHRSPALVFMVPIFIHDSHDRPFVARLDNVGSSANQRVAR